MTDDDVGAILAALDRPLAPPAEVAEQMWARAAAALRAPALDVAGQPLLPAPGGELVDLVEPAHQPAHGPRRRRRLQSPRSRLLAAAAVVVVAALVAGLLTTLGRQTDRVTAAGSGTPFRARVQASNLSPSGPAPQPVPVPRGGALAPGFEQIISHGGDGRWRVEWVEAPAGMGGPGSYEVWDRDRRLIYRADANTYRIEDPGDPVTNTPVASYVDLDEVAEDCDRVERVDSGGAVANRATRLLRCFRDATETQPATGEALWVDAVTGLLLRRETTVGGEVHGRDEVLEVEYSPDFDPDTFSVTPPEGAQREQEEEDSALGSVLVKGREAPGWEAPRLGGGQISTSELRGRPAIFLLWSSWCEPCVGDTLLTFDRMASAWSGQVSLIAVAVNDDEADAAAKVSELGMTVPVALDPKGDRVKPWDLSAVPAYVFLDGNGVVGAVRLSPLAPEELAAAIDDLAAGRPLDVVAEPPPPPPCEQPVKVEAGPGAPGVSGRVYFGVVYAKGAYGSCPVPTGPYVITPNGSGVRRISDDDDFRGVAVSSTGELVREIWTGPERRGAGESQELWLVRRSLQHRIKLVDRGSDPVWSHDGQRIAFVRKDTTGTVVAVAVVNRDGTGERTVSTDQNVRSITSRLAWEPGDGALIADLASAGGDASTIARYALDGSPPTTLLLNASTPAVSSRDATLAFIHSDPQGADHGRIELARPDGKGRRFLTPPRSAAVPAFYELDFSPDGAWLVASGSPDAADPYPRRRIYLVEVATGVITELASLGVRPSW